MEFYHDCEKVVYLVNIFSLMTCLNDNILSVLV